MRVVVKICSISLLLVPLPPAVATGRRSQSTADVVCETGPLVRKFDGGEWYLYSCSDDRSLIAIASPQNRAAKPFAFLVSPNGGVTQLRGEGNRSGGVAAAYEALRALRPLDIARLVALTKTSRTSPNRAGHPWDKKP